MKLKLYVNGSDHYELEPNGDVTKVSVFPVSTPGPEFMKIRENRLPAGNIGEEGYKTVLNKVKKDIFTFKAGYSGSARALRPFQKDYWGRVFGPAK